MKSIFIRFGYMLFIVFGRVKDYFVYGFYRQRYSISKKFTFVGSDNILEGNGDIVLGDSSHMARGCWLLSDEGDRIVIGERTRIGSNVTMVTSNAKTHQIFHTSGQRSKGDIVIGDDCWIGVNVYIREGVTVGNNCVLGANSIVTKNVPDNTIVVGINRQLPNTVDNLE